MEGSDFQAFTKIQYTVLSQIIIAIHETYPKTRRHLAGHSDTAPNRKTDPGDFFDWQHLRSLIHEQYNTIAIQNIIPEIF